MRLAWRLFACTTILASGCSVSTIANKAPVTAPDPGPAIPAGSVTGIAHGGQFPIANMRVYMFRITVSTSGYGQPSTSMLSGAGVTTDAVGGFVSTNSLGVFHILSTNFTCSAGQKIYLYGRGGNPNQGIADNEAASLMALLGDCNSLPSSVQMNEITTVAAAYALAGFAKDATDISVSTTNATGLTNAVNNAANLASVSLGTAQATGDANGTTLQQTIISLANILGACINETSGSTSCTKLFGDVMSAGTSGATAGETATEAIYIAHNPGTNVGTPTTGLFSLITSTPAFSGGLSGAPNDWTLAITWNALGGTTNLAVDASGNVWATNDVDNKISERSPTGANLSGLGYTGGVALSNLTGIAIDDATPSPNIYVTSVNTAILPKISSANPTTGGTSTSAGANGLINPYNLAIDASGNIWVGNLNGSSSSISKFSSTLGVIGNFTTTNTAGGTNFLNPEGIAIDPSNGHVWASNAGCVPCGAGSYGTFIAELSGNGSAVAINGTGGGLQAPIFTALDHSGNVWMSNFEGMPSSGFNGSISEFNNSGTAVSGTNGITGGGVSGNFGGPYGIAVDGDGKVWTANLGPAEASNVGSVSAYNPSTTSFLSPANGFQAGLNKPNGIAIDASGNVWVAINGDGHVTELVGAAAPVVVPLVTAVKNNTVGTRP